MKLTKEDTIKAIELCFSRNGCGECPLGCPDEDCSDLLLKNALHYLKENEPAPSGNDTSSKENYCQLNDSTKLQTCQEKIADIKEDLLLIYEDMTNEEQMAWELGEIFNQMINLLKSGDNK